MTSLHIRRIRPPDSEIAGEFRLGSSSPQPRGHILSSLRGRGPTLITRVVGNKARRRGIPCQKLKVIEIRGSSSTYGNGRKKAVRSLTLWLSLHSFSSFFCVYDIWPQKFHSKGLFDFEDNDFFVSFNCCLRPWIQRSRMLVALTTMFSSVSAMLHIINGFLIWKRRLERSWIPLLCFKFKFPTGLKSNYEILRGLPSCRKAK
jgi:hypothetical protein